MAADYDVLIIGSGASGGMVAHTLTQKGIKCLMLDAGPAIDFERHRTLKPVYDLPYRGFGRPQGIAFDADGRLYVAASLAGRRGIIRVDTERNAEMFLSGPGIVGLAFTPGRSAVLSTHAALYRVDVDIAGYSPF